jgi:hypothetical protein
MAQRCMKIGSEDSEFYFRTKYKGGAFLFSPSRGILPLIPNIEYFPYLGLFLLLVLGGFGLPSPEDVILFQISQPQIDCKK